MGLKQYVNNMISANCQSRSVMDSRVMYSAPLKSKVIVRNIIRPDVCQGFSISDVISLKQPTHRKNFEFLYISYNFKRSLINR